MLEIIVFITLFVALFFWMEDFRNPFSSASDDLELLKSTIEEVGPLPIGSMKNITLELNKNSAIIGFNPGKDFLYTYLGFNPSLIQHTFFMKGFYFERPQRGCAIDSACLCLCEDLGFETPLPNHATYKNIEDAFITCGQQLKCVNIDETKLKPRMRMDNVFDDWKTRQMKSGFNVGAEPAIRKDHYWDNSFIILRSDRIDPREYLGWEGGNSVTHFSKAEVDNEDVFLNNEDYKIVQPLIVSGFRDYYTLGIIDVTVVNYGINQVGICFKKDCTPIAY